MTDSDKVEVIVFDEGDGIQVDFKFRDEFDYENPSPVEDVAMAMFMYVTDNLKGEIIDTEEKS
jgi:hypothetical protein